MGDFFPSPIIEDHLITGPELLLIISQGDIFFLHILLLSVHFGIFPMTTVARFIDISQSSWILFNYKWPERRITISRQNTCFSCIRNESLPFRTQRNLYYSLPDFCLYSGLTASRDWWGYEFMTIIPKGSRRL